MNLSFRDDVGKSSVQETTILWKPMCATLRYPDWARSEYKGTSTVTPSREISDDISEVFVDSLKNR